jgi:hypothetical protein
MNAAELQKQRVALEAERERLKKRVERRRLEQTKDERRNGQIEQSLERLKILEQLNVPAGVVMEVRYPENFPRAKFNDAAGTLISVRRLWGLVDFGELGKWNVRLSELLPAAERDRQGRYFMIGGG